MRNRVLYLAWQDKGSTRQWFPVGRLDVSSSNYKFRYLAGAQRAHDESGFEALYDFPNFYKEYESPQLFPLFKNRVLTKGRRDFEDYLKCLNLSGNADSIEILSVDGGTRVTDSFEVFPEPVRREDGSFVCKFFVHGIRHINTSAQERVTLLSGGEDLLLAVELTNPVTKIAIQLQTEDHYIIGWTPRYLVDDLVHVISNDPDVYRAKIIKVNVPPAPFNQRILVELSCKWPEGHRPMSKNDFHVIGNR